LVVKAGYEIPIRGAAEPRNVRAEIVKEGAVTATSSWIMLGAGDKRLAQVTLDAPPGEYQVRQATNVGSNIHEDLVTLDLGAIEHGN
jgi:hypothetical protein